MTCKWLCTFNLFVTSIIQTQEIILSQKEKKNININKQ